MGWFGTLIGSSLGFVFGGPLGAIGGAALGHILIDRPNKQFAAGARGSRINIHERRQAGYFLALFSIMGKIAVADNRISESERQLVRQFISQSGMNDTQGQYALRVFEEAAQSLHSIADLTNQFYRLTAGQSQYHLNFMDFLVRLASVDGVLDTNERRMLHDVAAGLYISDEDFRLLLNRSAHTGKSGSGARAGGGGTQNAYRILGCTAKSSDSEIRSAYRRLAAAYHPDKIISKDLPDEFTQLANSKFQEIQSAYQEIKQARGIK